MWFISRCVGMKGLLYFFIFFREVGCPGLLECYKIIAIETNRVRVPSKRDSHVCERSGDIARAWNFRIRRKCSASFSFSQFLWVSLCEIRSFCDPAYKGGGAMALTHTL